VTTTRRAFLVGFGLTVLSLGALWCANVAYAAKPPGGGGGGSHTGLILYSTYQVPTTIYQMYEDGSSKAAALPPGVTGLPSSGSYGGARWWLASGVDPDTGFYEIFAFRADGSSNVQLTSLAADGFDVANAEPRWSNDLLDSSVTLLAGKDVDNDSDTDACVLRLPIGGADVAAIESGAAPRLTAADCEMLLVLPPDPSFAYACSSNPSQLAYLVGSTVWVRTLAANPNDPPTDVPIHTASKIKLGTWAHDGSRIAFYTLNTSAYGGVWTIRPDGSGLVKVKSNSGTMSYGSPFWSPDSQELLVLTIKDRGFGVWYYNLARMPAGGGTLTTLTNDLTQSLGQSPVGWVPYP
jgi:hypothetical protein